MLTGDQCADFGSPLEANSTVELCTGRKTAFEEIYQFKRVLTKSDMVTFKTEGKVRNTLGIQVGNLAAARETKRVFPVLLAESPL